MAKFWRHPLPQGYKNLLLFVTRKNSYTTIANNLFFETGAASIPVITFVSETLSKVSDETGFTQSTIVFRSDQVLDSFEVRADGTGVQGSGILLESQSGSFPANTDISFNILYSELTNGDKSYTIDIFGHTSAGWNSRIS